MKNCNVSFCSFKGLAAVAALASFVTVPAFAQSSDCGDRLATSDIFQCLVDEHAVADKALNTVYGDIQASLRSYSQKRSQALVAAQRAWITLRDLDCTSEGLAFDGGSFQKVVVQACLNRKTMERTAELEAHYELQTP